MTDRLLLLAHDPRMRRLETKLEVVQELRGANSEKAVPLLLELVCDPSWRVREEAAAALVERGRSVVPSLVTLLGQGLWYTRTVIAEALGRIGDLGTAEALAQRLTDDHPNVQQAATGALAKLAARHGTEPIAAALSAAGIDPAALAAQGPLARALAGAKPPDSGHS
jgi:HEAT repeat protein